MNYNVIDPSPDLQPFVKCFWTLEDDAASEAVRQRVVPDGCMEMIFNYGDRYFQYPESGERILQPRSFIFGQITSALEIEPSGRTGIIAARFLPHGLEPFLGIPLANLENKAVALDEIFGEAGSELERQVLVANDTAQRIQAIEDFLFDKMKAPTTIDSITRSCVDAILQSQGQMPMTALSEKLNINRRSLERKFETMVGLSPKQLAKMVRLQAAIRMMDQNTDGNLTSLAYESGYYDQAHFIKDFREFTGISPKSFFAGNLKFSALFASSE